MDRNETCPPSVCPHCNSDLEVQGALITSDACAGASSYESRLLDLQRHVEPFVILVLPCRRIHALRSIHAGMLPTSAKQMAHRVHGLYVWLQRGHADLQTETEAETHRHRHTPFAVSISTSTLEKTPRRCNRRRASSAMVIVCTKTRPNR